MDPNAENYWNLATVPGPCLHDTPYGLIEYSSFVYDDPTNGLSVDLSWSFLSSADGGCDTAVMHYGDLGDIQQGQQSSLAAANKPSSPHSFDESHVGTPWNNTFVEGNEYEWRVKCSGTPWAAPWNNVPPYHPINTFKFEVNPLATQSGAYTPPPVEVYCQYALDSISIAGNEENGAFDAVGLELLLQQAGVLETYTGTGEFGPVNNLGVTILQYINQSMINNTTLPVGASIVVKRNGVVVADTGDNALFGDNNWAFGSIVSYQTLFPGVGQVFIPNFDFQQGDIITIE